MNRKNKIALGTVAVIALLTAGYFVLDDLLFDGVKPRSVNEQGFQAAFFAKNEVANQPSVVLVGGGNWGSYWGQELAKANYVGLSLPYIRQAGLPALAEEIPLEYFQQAIDWLREQPEVNPDKVIVMGASRNAELALLIASYFPEIVHGTIAYSPSSVSWSNTVLPHHSDTIKPSWTFGGSPVPYVAMEKLKGGQEDTVETLTYWKKGLQDSNAVQQAIVRVENITGPMLLLSGLEDEVWPAAMMGDMIAERLESHDFGFPFEHVKYEDAGHLVSGNPNHPSSSRSGSMTIDGKSYAFRFGGTPEGDRAAQQDASARVFNYLSKL